jgi:hypothetical protein
MKRDVLPQNTGLAKRAAVPTPIVFNGYASFLIALPFLAYPRLQLPPRQHDRRVLLPQHSYAHRDEDRPRQGDVCVRSSYPFDSADSVI